MMRTLTLTFVLACLAPHAPLHAQALAAASGGGSYITVGGGEAAFRARYGNQLLAGSYAFADLNLTPHLGAEAEVRLLRQHSAEAVTEDTFLAGLRVTPRPFRRFSPYGKLLAGVGHITLPFRYATGSFLVLAPSAGVDIHLNDRLTLRAADFQYQTWQSFPYGALHPYGISAGISYRINSVARFPGSRRGRE